MRLFRRRRDEGVEMAAVKLREAEQRTLELRAILRRLRQETEVYRLRRQTELQGERKWSEHG